MNFVINLQDRSATRRALVVAIAVLRAQAAEDGEDMSEELGALVHLKRQLLKAPTAEEFNSNIRPLGWSESGFRTAEEQERLWETVPEYPEIEVSMGGTIRSIGTREILPVFGPDDDPQGKYVLVNGTDGVEQSVMISWLRARAFKLSLPRGY